MSESHQFQKLINGHYGIGPDEAMEIFQLADDAGSTLPLGMAAIGNLMYYASENPEYGEQAIRQDMFNIGLLMRIMGNFQVAIRTAEDNARYAVRKAGKKGAVHESE